MLRCACDSRNRAASADDVGREYGDRSCSPAVTCRAQKLQGLPRIHFLHFCQFSFRDFALYYLSPMGVFLCSLLAFRMGNAGCSGRCTSPCSDRGVQAFPLPLHGDLGAWPTDTSRVSGAGVVVLRLGLAPSIVTCPPTPV